MLQKLTLTVLLFITACSLSFATSDAFPPSAQRPVVADFLTSPNNTYYCSPTGNNTTGDGSINNPWVDFIGANGTVRAGDLIYLRGGTYPSYSYVNFSRSQNNLTVDGTASAPIVITNYPGEIARWNSTDTTWSLTLGGDHQKLIGTMVGNEYGIQITGGASIHMGNYIQVSNVEFSEGTYNGGDNNGAQLADGLNTYTQLSTVISHNYFHDAVFENTSFRRMAALKFFTQRDTIIEYNLFEDNAQVYRGCVEFKDGVWDATIRYNTFINCGNGEGSRSYSATIAWGPQGDTTEGMEIYENLVVTPKHFLGQWSDNGNTTGINVFNNVVLGATGGMIMYLNADGQTWAAPYNLFDNVFVGNSLWMGEADPHAADGTNLPDMFDYNLWYDSDDRLESFGNYIGTINVPSAYYDHAVTAPNAVNYNATTRTATVADDYAGRGQGRTGGNIGGFKWDGSSPPESLLPPLNVEAATSSSN